MKRPGRRTFLRNTGLAITAAALSEQVSGPAAAQTPAQPKQTAEAPPDLTQKLSHFIVTTRYEDLPDAVRHEAKRTLLNWVGCAIGGAPQETVGNAIAALAPFTESRRATLFGRTERMDALNAALVNGISSHVLDFDDTHAETGIHPAAPIAPAILGARRAAAGRRARPHCGAGGRRRDRVPDRQGGVAVALRDRLAHHRHDGRVRQRCRERPAARPRRTADGLGARPRRGPADRPPGDVRLDDQELPSRQGGAERPHRSAVREHGYTASEHALEAKRGWLTMLSAARNYAAFTNESWDILANSYKPFACGLVVHPVIDGCIELRNRNHLDPDMIERVEVGVNPRVMLVTAIQDPKTGLEGKFSVNHAAAVALIDGAAGEKQFTDEAVRAPAVAALRRRVIPTVDPSIGKEQARVAIVLKNGERLTTFVEHAVGSLQKPLSDRGIEDKFRGLADGILPSRQAEEIIDLCWRADTLADAGDIARKAGKV